LAVEQEVIESEEVKANPEAFRRIGEEITEMLDCRPVLPAPDHTAQVRAQTGNGTSSHHRSLVPESLQQYCIAAPGLPAQAIVSKYGHHLPLYRQQQIYWDQHRVWLPRQS
jgi:transposase